MFSDVRKRVKNFDFLFTIPKIVFPLIMGIVRSWTPCVHPTSVIRRDPSGSPSGAQKTLGSIRILDPDGFSSIRKNFRKKYILIRTAEGCISQPNYLINSDPGGKPLIRTEISSIRTKISGLPDDWGRTYLHHHCVRGSDCDYICVRMC